MANDAEVAFRFDRKEVGRTERVGNIRGAGREQVRGGRGGEKLQKLGCKGEEGKAVD